MEAGFPYIAMASSSTSTECAEVASGNRPHPTTNLDASSRYAIIHPFPSMKVQSVCHMEFEYLLSKRTHFLLICFLGSSLARPIPFSTPWTLLCGRWTP
jgi:hypothetical protein